MPQYRAFWTLIKREILRYITLPNQTILPAFISAMLFIVVFGFFLGKRVDNIEGHDYIIFIFPGLLMMGVVSAAYQNSSTTLFISRWLYFIEDLLVAPLSFVAMVTAFVLASVLRALITGGSILVAGLLLIDTPLEHPFLLLLSLTTASIVFAASGLVVGLWAERWDNIAIFQTYLIQPLLFLGGVFYSTSTLPEGFRWVNIYNPMYYIVTSVRYAFLGSADETFARSYGITLALAAFFLVWAIELFRRGYKLRT